MDAVKYQAANALPTVPHLVEEADEPFFCAAIFSQEDIPNVVYIAVEHVIFEQTRAAMLDETINKNAGLYFEAKKPLKHMERGCFATASSSPPLNHSYECRLWMRSPAHERPTYLDLRP